MKASETEYINKSQTMATTADPLPWAFYDLIRCLVRIYEAHRDEIEAQVRQD